MGVDTKLEWNGDKKKKDVNQGTIRALIRSANLVQATAKLIITDNGNIDTGNLRSSIVQSVKDFNLSATVSTNVEYGQFIEFGTRYSPAQPFIRPGLNDNKDKIRKIFTIEESKAVDK
jgi:HK97 gp10 family phage protein